MMRSCTPEFFRASRRRIVLAALLLAFALAAPSARAKDPRLKWDKSWGPMVPHKKFPKDCSLCHVAKRWDVLRSDFSFDHKKETGYPLLGAHANASCLRCHNDRGPVKAYLSRGCSGCHVDPHKSSLGLDCEHCHDQAAWIAPGRQGQKVADHARTRFPLTGMHAVIDCRQCHLTADQGQFKAMPIDCLSCHRREYSAAPNHAAQNYSQDCRSCHQTSAWVGAVFNHSFLGPNPVCYNCHKSQYAAAPNHVALNFSQSCQTCHQTATWLGAGFNHSQLGPNPVCYSCHAANFAAANATPASKHAANGFPQAACANCHNTTSFGPGTAMQHSFVSATPCSACHTADFTAAPNHVAQGFSTNCLSCHSGTSTWLGALFDHTSLGANPVCITCHSTEYAGAKPTPASRHTANGFPQTCANCHNTAAWGPGTTMQHSFVSATPCYTCHTADFTAAPNHVAQGFSTACQTCHTGTATWLGAVFDHTSLGANPVCTSCHQTEYAAAKTTPASNHAANSFPQTCQNCHNTTSWGPGTAMQHSFVPTACQNCHTADFNSATSPVNHTAQGIFASACSTCHTSYTVWTGFTHNPSNCFNTGSSSAHQNARCIQCHTSPVYTTSSCTACHANRGTSCGN